MHTTDINIYGLPVLLIIISILFIVRWRFYAGRYKNKYTVAVTAQVTEVKRAALFIPLIVYEANVNGKAEKLIELPPIGAPALRLPPGAEVKLYIHPDPEKRKRVMFTEKSRPFVNELTAPFNSLFFELLGLGFILAAIVIFKLSAML
ncbi:MAG: hypothetical protein K6B44_14280 [Lachnospiraceae bacterium]|nr:hypothetical protein [Lachnospiraceae bacterium]